MSALASSSCAISPFRRGEILAIGFLLVGVAAVLVFRLGAAPPTVNAEERCWKVVSEMTRTGDWLVPRRDGKPFLNKPPLFYWAATAVSRMAGGASFATLRLPSVLAALGLILLTLYWACSIGGKSLAVAATAFLALMWSLYEYGRLGTYDMLLSFLGNAALVAFDRLYASRNGRLLVLFFFLVLAAFLTKGPPAFLIVGLPTVLFLGFRRDLRLVLSPTVIGCTLVTLLFCLLWFIILIWRVPEAYDRFYSELVLPFGGQTAHHTAAHYRSPLYYFSRVFAITWPACLLLPLAIWRGWQTGFWRDDPRLRFCAWISAGLFVGFSLFPQKRSYYLLPILTPLAILTADAVLWAIEGRAKPHWAWLGVPAAAAGAGVALLSVPVSLYLYILLRVPFVLVGTFSAILVSLGAATVYLALQSRWKAAIGVFVLAFWSVSLVYFGSFLVWRDQFETETVVQRPDYDETHWNRMKDRYAVVARIFRSKVKHEEEKDKPTP